MTSWNYAEVYEAIAEIQPDQPAISQGDRTITWGAFDRRTLGLATWLANSGAHHQDKVALYLYNSPEYMEGLAAALRIGLVPINTNYRYGTDELAYLWENADATTVIFHGAFTVRIEEVLSRVGSVRNWLWVDDGSGPCPPWARAYEDIVMTPGEPEIDWTRSPDDLVMLYTGGTTGMPKGVMWRQDDLFVRVGGGVSRVSNPVDDLEGLISRLVSEGSGPTLLPACPLMHGTGQFTAMNCLATGGHLVLLEGRHYSPSEHLEAIERYGVNTTVIVGDPFARPLLETLTEHPGRFDLSSLTLMASSGAMWSHDIKAGLLAIHPTMLLADAFSSTEAIGMGTSVSSAGREATTAKFTLGPEVTVLDEDGQPVVAGSGQVGVLALAGRNPVGYYKDPVKSDATFKVIDGTRYSIPGDYAEVLADGSIHLLGRGSQCINTAGEKVYPEEVEEVLKTHPDVHDACVVGVPHARYGEAVTAAIELNAGARGDQDELIAHVRDHLAHYKAPRRIRFVPTIGRSPSGKMDYGRHKREAAAEFADLA